MGSAAHSGNQTTLYLTPMHAEAGLIKSMIANVHAAIRHVKVAAEQLPKLDRWRLLLAYICQSFVVQTGRGQNGDGHARDEKQIDVADSQPTKADRQWRREPMGRLATIQPKGATRITASTRFGATTPAQRRASGDRAGGTRTS